MGVSDFITIAGIVLGLVAGVGLLVITLTRPDFRVARLSAWIIAFGLASLPFVWGISTTAPFWVRAIGVGLPVLLVAIVLNEALRWLSAREGSLSPNNFIQVQCYRADFSLPKDGKFFHLQAIYKEGEEPLAQFTEHWLSEYAAQSAHVLPGANSDLYKCTLSNHLLDPV